MPEIKASPRNKVYGLLADLTQSGIDFASRPFGYDNPPVAMMAGLLGLPAVANTLNELSYGGALGTGSGMTWKPKADTVDAAMTLLPLGATAGKAAIDGGVALAKKAAPAIERAVPRVMERGGLSSQLLRDLSQNTVSPATVWHGSPHKFDKFDASKIGTGEGAQAYGHGIYFAESPETASFYRDKLTSSGTILSRGDALEARSNVLRKVADRVEKSDPERAAKLRAEADTFTRDGALYKVDLPDDAIAKMLDWDKPLSQQHPDVQAVLLKHPDVLDQIQKAEAQRLLLNERSPMRLEKIPSASVPYDASRMAGKDALTAIQQRSALGKTGGVEEQLRQAGIPGIRYLDGGSRGTGAGTSNFVVFPGNEGLLTILERNGQPVNQLRGLLGTEAKPVNKLSGLLDNANPMISDKPNAPFDGSVLVDVPLDKIEHGESVMPGGKLTWPGSRDLIRDYAGRETELPPIELMSPDEAGQKWMISDGSHRFEAAKLRGDKSIKAYVLRSDAEDFGLLNP